MGIQAEVLHNIPIILRGYSRDGVIVYERHKLYPEYTDNYIEDLLLIAQAEDYRVVRIVLDITLNPRG